MFGMIYALNFYFSGDGVGNGKMASVEEKSYGSSERHAGYFLYPFADSQPRASRRSPLPRGDALITALSSSLSCKRFICNSPPL